jgi:predicted metal-dependent hydrolase
MKGKILKIQNTEINFRKSLKARNISIRIKPFEGVLVTVPSFLSFKIAKDFVESKMSWIQKNLHKIQSQEQLQTNFIIGSIFKTKFHSIFIDSYSEEKNTFLKENKSIKIYISDENEIQSIENQNYIRNVIEKILRIEAKSFLPKRVDELAKKHNFNYQKLAIKNTKTRWGSCSFKNNINLSLHLMRLREELIDYVILHELVHTKVKNHSIEFWTTLDIHCPNSKNLDRELKKYSLRIF